MAEIDPITRQWIRNASDQRAAEAGYFYHPASAQKVIDFAVKICRKPPLPWQEDEIRRLFGWRRPDGTRRFTRGYISVAKKNGKTLLSSILATYILICEKGDVVSAANSRGQASEVFKDMQAFVTGSPTLTRHCQLIPSTKHIFVKTTLATYHAMSADASTGDGVRARLAIYDEYHRARDSSLYDILQPAGEGQAEPLFLVITTSGESLTTPCGELCEYARRIIAGNITDDAELGFYASIYEAAEDDDINVEATWRKANPALGLTVDMQRFRADYLEASQSPSRLASFRRLRLNQWVSADTEAAWLDQDAWAACGSSLITLDMLRGRPCRGGLDLSSTRDVSALVLLFEFGKDDTTVPAEARGKLFILPYFWLPSSDMPKREKRDGVPYWAWAQDPANHLDLTPGNVIDYAYIRAKLNELRGIFEITDVAIDRWNATQLITDLSGDGFDMVPFGQGFGSMNAPTKEFERRVLCREMMHANNPLLNHMAGKVIVETDAAGNIKPSKKKSMHRIDGIVAGIMALGRQMTSTGDALPDTLVA